MATLCHSHQNIYAIAAINIFFFLLVDYSVIATSNIIENDNGGFSAHLIRRNSPNSPLYKHNIDNEVSRRLIGSDMPRAPLETRMRTNKMDAGHIMKLSIGTPPTDIYLLSDTGSDLLWTQCQPCLNCYETKYPMFDSEKSSTYSNISCGAEDCRYFDGLVQPFDYPVDYCKHDPEKTCVYRNAYADTSYSEGFLAKETITMISTKGKPVALQNITVGCGIKNGQIVPVDTEMGVIGLGRGSLSFVSQIAPYVGGKRFSHCLVPMGADPTMLSKIYFGSGSELLGEGVVSTPLVEVKGHESSYMVTAAGMTIGDEFVSFNSSNGTMLNLVVDSGTPISHVPKHIFDQVIPPLMKKIGPKYEPVVTEEEPPVLTEEKEENQANMTTTTKLCINTSTYPREETILTLHFLGGGQLPLTADQLFYKEDDNDKLCLVMVKNEKMSSGGVGYFGGVSQGNLLIAYDLDKKVVSFKPANCLN